MQDGLNKRGGRKPDVVVAQERGITVEKLREERRQRLAKKQEQFEEPHEFVRRFDPELNDIAQALREAQAKITRLTSTRVHERRLDFLCEEFVQNIRKHDMDPEIVMGRLRKLFEGD